MLVISKGCRLDHSLLQMGTREMSQLWLALLDNQIWIREMNRLRLGLKDSGIHNQKIMFIEMNRLTLNLIDAWHQVDEMSWL